MPDVLQAAEDSVWWTLFPQGTTRCFMTAPIDPATTMAAGHDSLILIGLLAAVAELLIGMALGWWLRGGKSKAPPPHTAKTISNTPSTP